MISKPKKKVFVGMSGGVDSSVTAALLKEREFDVTGIYIKCYNVDGCSERDAEDARRVAGQLGIPFYVFDFEEEYKKRVVEYMIDGYRAGITPNPDVMCNKEIKFGLFLEKALQLGADYVATGHYVRLRRKLSISNIQLSKKIKNKTPQLEIGNWKLEIARDSAKDQSYFLWTLTQKQLAHCLFPIGEYTKPEVRKLAKKFGLVTAEKKDSQGICFLGQVSILDFLKNYIPEKPGEVLNLSGEIIGRHRGAHFYTIGQREGLESGDWKRATRGGKTLPFYVVSKDIKNNTITVSEGDADPWLYRKEVELANVNFINSKSIIGNWELGIKVMVRVRYRQPLVEGTLEMENLRTVKKLKLKFDKPVKYVAEGQSAVFYDKKGMMLGGGVIT
jgi:tRNA-specific 2-thiouridylase